MSVETALGHNATVDWRPTRHHRYAGDIIRSDADLAVALSAAYGLSPDHWQGLVLSDWLAIMPNGKWAHLTCGVSVARQNGKNAVIEIRELYGLVGLGERILHTAHQVKTAMKAFKRLLYFFGSKPNDPHAKFPELNALVESIRNVNGQEAIFLKNGGSVEIVARSKSSARGFTVDTIIFDEAQEMTEDDLEALMPTTSSAPLGNPQWIFTGTPPGPNASGEVFTRIRSEIHINSGARSSWQEWGVDPGVDLDDRNTWRRVNPALDSGRLQWEVIEGERARFSDEGFLRERLGGWSAAASQRVISAEAWELARDPKSMAVDRFALAVDVAPDMSTASVALAGIRDDGTWHIDIGVQQAGYDWVVPWVRRFLDANPQVLEVVIDLAGPAAALIPEIQTERIRVRSPQVRDVGVACMVFVDGILTGNVRHLGDYRLTLAIDVWRKRTLGTTGLWAWNRKDLDSDITPLVASTLALWGAQQSRTARMSQRRTNTKERRATVI